MTPILPKKQSNSVTNVEISDCSNTPVPAVPLPQWYPYTPTFVPPYMYQPHSFSTLSFPNISGQSPLLRTDTSNQMDVTHSGTPQELHPAHSCWGLFPTTAMSDGEGNNINFPVNKPINERRPPPRKKKLRALQGNLNKTCSLHNVHGVYPHYPSHNVSYPYPCLYPTFVPHIPAYRLPYPSPSPILNEVQCPLTPKTHIRRKAGTQIEEQPSTSQSTRPHSCDLPQANNLESEIDSNLKSCEKTKATENTVHSKTQTKIKSKSKGIKSNFTKEKNILNKPKNYFQNIHDSSHLVNSKRKFKSEMSLPTKAIEITLRSPRIRLCFSDSEMSAHETGLNKKYSNTSNSQQPNDLAELLRNLQPQVDILDTATAEEEAANTDSTDIALTNDDAESDMSDENEKSTFNELLERDFQWILLPTGNKGETFDNAMETMKSEVSLWRAKLIVSLCQNHRLSHQDWCTLQSLVCHSLPLEKKLSLLDVSQIFASNYCLGVQNIRNSLMQLVDVAEVLLLPKPQRRLRWNEIPMEPPPSFVTLKGSFELLKLMGYELESKDVLMYNEAQRKKTSIIARLTIDLIIISEELFNFMTGKHQCPVTITQYFTGLYQTKNGVSISKESLNINDIENDVFNNHRQTDTVLHGLDFNECEVDNSKHESDLLENSETPMKSKSEPHLPIICSDSSKQSKSIQCSTEDICLSLTNSKILASQSEYTQTTEDNQNSNIKSKPEDHIYEEISEIRKQVQALRDRDLEEIMPPLPQKTKLRCSSANLYPDVKSSENSLNIENNEINSRKIKKRAPMSPGFLIYIHSKKKIDSDARNHSSLPKINRNQNSTSILNPKSTIRTKGTEEKVNNISFNFQNNKIKDQSTLVTKVESCEVSNTSINKDKDSSINNIHTDAAKRPKRTKKSIACVKDNKYSKKNNHSIMQEAVIKTEPSLSIPPKYKENRPADRCNISSKTKSVNLPKNLKDISYKKDKSSSNLVFKEISIKYDISFDETDEMNAKTKSPKIKRNCTEESSNVGPLNYNQNSSQRGTSGSLLKEIEEIIAERNKSPENEEEKPPTPPPKASLKLIDDIPYIDTSQSQDTTPFTTPSPKCLTPENNIIETTSKQSVSTCTIDQNPSDKITTNESEILGLNFPKDQNNLELVDEKCNTNIIDNCDSTSLINQKTSQTNNDEIDTNLSENIDSSDPVNKNKTEIINDNKDKDLTEKTNPLIPINPGMLENSRNYSTNTNESESTNKNNSQILPENKHLSYSTDQILSELNNDNMEKSLSENNISNHATEESDKINDDADKSSQENIESISTIIQAPLVENSKNIERNTSNNCDSNTSVNRNITEVINDGIDKESLESVEYKPSITQEHSDDINVDKNSPKSEKSSNDKKCISTDDLDKCETNVSRDDDSYLTSTDCSQIPLNPPPLPQISPPVTPPLIQNLHHESDPNIQIKDDQITFMDTSTIDNEDKNDDQSNLSTIDIGKIESDDVNKPSGHLNHTKVTTDDDLKTDGQPDDFAIKSNVYFGPPSEPNEVILSQDSERHEESNESLKPTYSGKAEDRYEIPNVCIASASLNDHKNLQMVPGTKEVPNNELNPPSPPPRNFEQKSLPPRPPKPQGRTRTLAEGEESTHTVKESLKLSHSLPLTNNDSGNQESSLAMILPEMENAESSVSSPQFIQPEEKNPESSPPGILEEIKNPDTNAEESVGESKDRTDTFSKNQNLPKSYMSNYEKNPTRIVSSVPSSPKLSKRDSFRNIFRIKRNSLPSIFNQLKNLHR